jgi:transposase
MVYQQHLDGINRSCLGRRKGIGAATVQRYFLRHLQRQARQDHPPVCPRVLGIDEHFFTRKKGYSTTFCDLKNHRIYDLTLGRSEAALESYFLRLEGKEQVRIVCMDLAVVYRSIVHKQFPRAVIVADRFHVIRLVNHHFLACWREIDPTGSKNRGLISLMRRHRHNLKPEQQVRLLAYLAERPALESRPILWWARTDSNRGPPACEAGLRRTRLFIPKDLQYPQEPKTPGNAGCLTLT